MATRRPRRAVGPPGAHLPADEPLGDRSPHEIDAVVAAEQDRADEERLRRDRPPHHDQER